MDAPPALPDSATPVEAETFIPSVSIDGLLARRDAVLDRCQAIQTAVSEIQALATTLGLDGDGLAGARCRFLQPISDGRYAHERFTSPTWLEDSTKTIDAALWDLLLHQSGLRSFMDRAARHQWDDDIEHQRTPPLTDDNIRATFALLHASRADFFKRGVVQLFRSLSWDYKSNLPHRFGRRLIVRHLAPHPWGVSPDTCNTLDDLLRVFHVLDGRPEPDHRLGVHSRLHQARSAHHDLVDDYVRVRTFKNGNGHVYLLRQDLVDRLNQILAAQYPNALPPAAD